MKDTPDISIRYALPRYYMPASLQTTCYLFIFSGTSFEKAKKTVDSLIESKKTIKSVRIYTEIGTKKDIVAGIQTYLITLDIEDIDVFKNLALLEIVGMMGYFQRDSTYREALRN